MSNFVNLLDIVYPVGSIYFSTSSTSPASSVGGTWTQIKDANIAAKGSKYTKDYIGSYKIDKKQLPHHAHTITIGRSTNDLSTLDTYGDSELEMWTGSANNVVNNTDKHQTQKIYNLNATGPFKVNDGDIAYSSGGTSNWITLMYAWRMPHGGGKNITRTHTLVMYGNGLHKSCFFEGVGL